jgi:hypothetical protein
MRSFVTTAAAAADASSTAAPVTRTEFLDNMDFLLSSPLRR